MYKILVDGALEIHLENRGLILKPNFRLSEGLVQYLVSIKSLSPPLIQRDNVARIPQLGLTVLCFAMSVLPSAFAIS
jgi:hypothetical protein